MKCQSAGASRAGFAIVMMIVFLGHSQPLPRRVKSQPWQENEIPHYETLRIIYLPKGIMRKEKYTIFCYEDAVESLLLEIPKNSFTGTLHAFSKIEALQETAGDGLPL
jgi:hypothetical protein